MEAVRAAADGESLVSPSVTTRLLERFAAASTVASAKPAEPLTSRELEVVRAVARGMTNAEICGELVISLSTVKTHLNGVQRKLGVRNRTEIAIWAWESHLMG